jgi:hypothetical protein
MVKNSKQAEMLLAARKEREGMADEEWRPIPGWEEWYEVSNAGRVRSWRHQNGRDRRLTPRLLAGQRQPQGYIQIQLGGRRQRTHILLHRLVLLAFVGPCPPGLQARHLDGDPTNNRLENLRYGTPAENSDDKWRHGTMPVGERCWNARLTAAQAEELYHLRGVLTIPEAARRYGVSRTIISAVWSKRSWSWLTSGQPEPAPLQPAPRPLKLDEEAIVAIRRRAAAGEQQRELAAEYQVGDATISRIIHRVGRYATAVSDPDISPPFGGTG